MSNRFPSFQWYPDDWLGSTARATLSPAGRAAYIDLLCHYWNGECRGLIQDEKWLRNLIGNNRISKADLQEVIGCFRKRHKKLHHPKLQAIYKERVAYVEGQKEAGKKGAKKRWGRHSNPKSDPTDSPMAENRSPSPSPSSSPSPEEEKRKTDPLPDLPVNPIRGSYAEPTGEVVRQLMQKAKAANIPNNPHTLRRYIKAWVARSSAAEVERILMLRECEGRTVIEIQDAHFKDNGKPKSGVDVWAADQKAKGLM